MSLRLEQELWDEVLKNRVENIQAEKTFPSRRLRRLGRHAGPGAPSPSFMHYMSHRAHAHTEHLDTQAMWVDGGREGLGGRAWWAPVVTT